MQNLLGTLLLLRFNAHGTQEGGCGSRHAVLSSVGLDKVLHCLHVHLHGLEIFHVIKLVVGFIVIPIVLRGQAASEVGGREFSFHLSQVFLHLEVHARGRGRHCGGGGLLRGVGGLAAQAAVAGVFLAVAAHSG